MSVEYWVYYFLDAKKRVIYVGSSKDPLGARLGAHKRGSAFFGEIRSVEIDGPYSKEDAALQEGREIMRIWPKYNKNCRAAAHNELCGPPAFNEFAEFNERMHRKSLERSLEVRKLRMEGLTYKEIAALMGISRQRVHQLGSKL